MEQPNDAQGPPAGDTIACPVCHEEILSTARKCKHCGELVGSRKTLRYFTTQIVTYVGVFTALMSTFYALREGYFYVQKQQQAREEVRSFQAVASHFEESGSLDYAELALQKAVEVRPNDQFLKQRLFLLRCRRLFTDMEWTTMPSDEQVAAIKALILEGHRLQQDPLSSKIDAGISLALARLIPQDGSFNDQQAPDRMFERAMALAPGNAEVLFRYGVWLVGSENQVEKGEQLLRNALSLAPEDALYHYETARHYTKKQQFNLAYQHFQRAIGYREKQSDIVRIQASNLARTELRRLFTQVAELFDVASDDFIELSLAERQVWIEQLLDYRSTDRKLNRYAADFYLASGDLDKALSSISRLVSEKDLQEPVRGYTLEDKERYLAILSARNENSALQQQLTNDIAAFRESQNWEEFLHWGIVGRHKYKVGLRVDKQLSGTGLKVLKVFSGFPFAKAGILAGDIINEMGHQRVQALNDVMIVMDKFSPGSEIPISIQRGEQHLEVNLVVE